MLVVAVNLKFVGLAPGLNFVADGGRKAEDLEASAQSGHHQQRWSSAGQTQQ
jgi:hypothetical protein